MDFETYQKEALRTDRVPAQGDDLASVIVPMLGLAGETGQLLQAAKRLGLRSHVHVGQLSDLGGAELAAKWGALSADHLEFISAAGARALAAAGTVAVLLPTAYFTLRQTTPPPVPMLREAGVTMAIATDHFPGIR